MKIEKNAYVILKSFLGTKIPPEKPNDSENYWKLIGTRGRVIACDEREPKWVFVLFEKNIDDMKLANHNPIKNSLRIQKTDLELDKYTNYIQKLDKEIAIRASFMSNAKWFKFFTEIENKNNKPQSSFVKLLLDDNKFSFHFSKFENEGFIDDGVVGPFKYKEIEWISIPKVYEIERWNRGEKLKSEVILQPIDEIEKAMNSLGKFEYEKTETELIIYGYR